MAYCMDNDRYFNYDAIPYMLDASKIQQILGLSRSAISEIMKTPGFPVVSFGRTKLVKKDDFFVWLEFHEKAEPPHSRLTKKTNQIWRRP